MSGMWVSATGTPDAPLPGMRESFLTPPQRSVLQDARRPISRYGLGDSQYQTGVKRALRAPVGSPICDLAATARARLSDGTLPLSF